MLYHKATTVVLPETPEERRQLRQKPSTMERYLDDQYEHWVQSPPPSTFNSQSPVDLKPPRVRTFSFNTFHLLFLRKRKILIEEF